MSYSRPFNPATDTFIKEGSVINPCYTGFYRVPLCNWMLNNQNSQYFMKGEASIGTRMHFTFQAFQNDILIGEKIGELPCPDLCLPGPPFTELKKFNLQHLFQLAFQVVGLEYIVLHKCIINDGAGQIDSYAIYGHDGQGPLINPHIHVIYVSMQ